MTERDPFEVAMLGAVDTQANLIQPKADPFDTAMEGAVAMPVARLNAAAIAAPPVTPDRYAEAQRLGESRGTSAEAVIPEFDSLAAQDRRETLATTAPATAAWAGADPANYAVAADELNHLSGFEKAWDRFTSFAAKARDALNAGTLTSTGGTLQMVGEQMNPLRQLEGQVPKGSWVRQVFKGLADQSPFASVEAAGSEVAGAGRQASADAFEGVAAPTGSGDLLKHPWQYREYAALQIAQSLPAMAVAMAARRPQLAGDVMGITTAGQSYQQDRAEGVDALTAATDAGAQGVLERGLGTLTFEAAQAPGLSAMRRILAASGTEAGTEGLTGAGQYAVGQGITGQPIDEDQLLRQTIESSLIGVAMGGPVGVIEAMVGHPKMQAIEDATRGAQFLAELQTTAENAKLKDRNPKALANLVASLKAQGGPQTAYIGGEDFIGLYQSEADAYRAAADYTGREDALEIALASGGDLAIPVDQAVRFLGSSVGKTAVMAMKLDPAHPTVAEVGKIDHEKEISQVMAEMSAAFEPTPEGETGAAQQDILGELVATGRYSAGDAQEMAKLLPRFYAGIARTTGRTVDEVRARYPVSVISTAIGDRLRRINPAAETLRLTPVLEAIRTGKIPSQRDAYGPSLVDELVKAGGVVDHGGELRNFDAGKARPGLMNKNGMPFDTALTFAREQGFFPPADENAPDTLEINDLLDAIDRDLRGDGVFRTIAANPALADLRETALAWENELPGLLTDGETIQDLMGLSNQAIMDRAARAAREAYEQDAPLATDTPAFRAWFGDSKVVDAEGRPLVVYHGTKADVESFDIESPRSYMAFGGAQGFYFAPDPDYASRYATGKGGKGAPNVISVYLNLRNPYTSRDHHPSYISPERRSELEAQGYDGIKFDNGWSSEYIAFHPEQIKSAIGNRGTFDPNDPNILHQPAFHGTHVRGIEKFSLHSIGTGMGNQAFGFGLYFTNSEELADYYRATASGTPTPQDKREPLYYAQFAIEAAGRERAADFIAGQTAYFPGAKLREDAIALIKSGEDIPRYTPGQIYGADVPEDSDLLDFDGPIDEQPAKVKDAIDSIIGSGALDADALRMWDAASGKGRTGKKFYTVLSQSDNVDGAKGASHLLGEAGVPGLRYFDRDWGDNGATNYVIWDESRIRVEQAFYQGSERGSIQFPRSGIGNGASLIRLAETAEQTTFLHEMGHFYLEVLAAESSAEDAPAALVEDFGKVLAWFGVSDAAAWNAMDLEAKRPFHEQFARGFERYLGEGKAPAPELRSAFRKFKAWIVSVYQDLRALNVELSPDVRGVFDRLLATEDEIRAAAEEQAFTPALPVDDARRLGMTEAALGLYAQTIERAKESLAAKVLHAKFRETRAWYRSQVRAERARVRSEADQLPVYRTIKALRTGEGLPSPVKLDKAALVGKYGEGLLTRLRGMYAVEGGQAPDLVAQALGWPDGDAMLTAIINAQPKADYIKAEADARVRERHGDPMTDGTVGNLAMDALHNARQRQALDAEIGLLAQLAGEAPPKPGILREAARRMIATQTGRQLTPHAHLVAERKAANAAVKAATAQKWGEALAAKRQQALAAALYSEAQAAQKKLDRIERQAKRLSTRAGQERLAKAGADYLDRVNELLAAYDFLALSGKQRDKRAGLRAWVEAMQEAGEVTAIASGLLDRVESERVVNWRDVPVSEITALAEALGNIEHLAGLKNRLLAGARTANKDAAVAEMIARAEAVLPKGRPDVVDANDLTGTQRIGETITNMADALTRPENLIEALDGGESGPWHDFLWAPQIAAENAKIGLMKRIGGALKTLHATLPADFWANTEQMVTFNKQSMKRYALISAAFNLGNAGNRQRLRDGGISTVSGKRLTLTDADLASIPGLLTAVELQYVQGVWDAIDSLRPDIAALTRRMGGVPVAFVEPAALKAVSADGHAVELRGGYWPLAYHSERSAVGERQEGDDALKILMQAGAARAATSKGHTKERVEEFNAPLLLNFGRILSRSLDQVMTDLSYREAVRDTSMLLKDQALKSFLIAKVGKSGYDSLNGGVAYSVSAGADVAGLVAGGWRSAMDWTIANGVVSALAIRPDIALGNYTSALVQGLDRVGKRSLLRGMRRLMLSRSSMTAEIMALSPMMENRLTEIDHGYQQALRKTQNDHGFRQAYFRLMMTLHRVADHEVTRALWWGRYEEARQGGAEPAEAVRLADKAVRQTQTATGKKDVATFERDPAFKQSRIFMGPMFVIFGRLRAAAAGTGTTRTVGTRAASLLIQWMLAPAVFALAAGRAPEDDDQDGEWGTGEWSRWLAINVGLFPLQTIPLVRDLETAIEAGISGKPISPRASPLAQAAASLAKGAKGVAKQLMADETDWSELTEDLVTTLAPFTGLPGSQYRKSNRAMDSVLDNPDRNAGELAELILYGKPVYSEPTD